MESEKTYIVEVIQHHAPHGVGPDGRFKYFWDEPFVRQVCYTGHGYTQKNICDAVMYSTVGPAKATITKQFKNVPRSLRELEDLNLAAGRPAWAYWVESVEIREVVSITTIPHLKVI